jgi:hypothetical protein
LRLISKNFINGLKNATFLQGESKMNTPSCDCPACVSSKVLNALPKDGSAVYSPAQLATISAFADVAVADRWRRVLIGFASVQRGVPRGSLIPAGTKASLEESCLIEDGVAQFVFNTPGTKSSGAVVIDFIR